MTTERMVVEALRLGARTAPQLSAQVRRSYGRVHFVLNNLEAEGRVRRAGSVRIPGKPGKHPYLWRLAA